MPPHSKNRHKIVLGSQKGPQPTDTEKKKSKAHISWARLMNRVFKTDVSKCQFCNADVKIVAAILEKAAIEKILSHWGLPTDAPIISQARPPPQAEFDAF